MKIDDLIHGFRLLRTEVVKEVDSTAYEFFHEKSGARLLFLENKDDNKVFSISFRTPPHDDTGVAHIVEHSTLCGSRKFPLKEPFVELVKGSLNTFLNAMTYPDKTMYPVASRNDKDFHNLMDVYLDAVFYPAMHEKKEVLLQEGWHYEIEKKDEPLRYSGVVYNEMKGALSSPDDILESRTMASLYPDVTYSYESGGDPEYIPDLTQEMFVDFHKKYYHPSNSYIFLYGDMDIEKQLAFLDEEYLSAFTKIPVPSKIEMQPLFSEMKKITEQYPVGADEDTAGKTFLSMNYLMGKADDAETMLALEILEHALLKTPAAPLKKALLDAKIGNDVYSAFVDALQQPSFSIVANGAEKADADKFVSVIEETLTGFVEKGLDRTMMEASLNLLEFKLREADFGQYPKGLIYNIKVMNSWLYDADPFLYLHYEEVLQKMKDGLDNGYFEQVIKKYFLTNNHKTLLVLEPSKTMAAEKAAKLEKKLAEIKASLTDEELEGIIAQTAKLKAMQQEKDSPEALQKIPVLELQDINKKPENLPLTEKMLEDIRVLHSDIKTSGIAYLNLYFDASVLPQELLPYGYLLTEILGTVDTEQHSYGEIDNLLNLHTGGVSYNLVPYLEKDKPDSCLPKLKVKAKALLHKLPQLCSLLTEILTGSSFADKKRLEEVLRQSRASMEMDMLRVSHQIMMSRLMSYTSPAGKYNEAGSLEFYWFVRDLTDNFAARYEEMAASLRKAAQYLFRKQGLIVGVTLPEADYGKFAEVFAEFIKSLHREEYKPAEYKWDFSRKNEGLLASSRVQFVGKGANFVKLGHKFTGSMRVLETILRYGYLWTNVRVKGGAYGAFVRFQRNGAMLLGSYRDPNLRETIEVFDKTAAYLRNFNASDREMTKYIIGTMSGIDMPLTPQMRGNAAAECWLQKITAADRQQVRDEVLATRQEDIRALADTVADCMDANLLCVFGNEVKLQENKDLFAEMRQVMK